MKKITVQASKEYDVLVGTGLIERAGELSLSLCPPCSACIVTDDTVDALYSASLTRSLQKSGYRVVKFVFPHGEASKNASTLVELLEFLAENNFTRTDCIFALGGGVVGDVAGLAASLFLRGIKYVQLPTTLLSAVDSSVGGKTAVDLAAGKNLCGTFYQPTLVICDYKTLDTLPENIFSDGCAEVIKYGIINDRALFDALRTGIRENIEDAICRCVQNKADIVHADEFESGERKLLNLGHTIGHAVELCSDFTISHGSAVSCGTVIATKIAVSLGLCKKEELLMICSLLESAGLPTSLPFSASELCEAAQNDKKRRGDTLSLILPYAIGDSRIYNIDISQLEELINRGLSV
jgi:3-dehydroquinate synthase